MVSKNKYSGIPYISSSDLNSFQCAEEQDDSNSDSADSADFNSDPSVKVWQHFNPRIILKNVPNVEAWTTTLPPS